MWELPVGCLAQEVRSLQASLERLRLEGGKRERGAANDALAAKLQALRRQADGVVGVQAVRE